LTWDISTTVPFEFSNRLVNLTILSCISHFFFQKVHNKFGFDVDDIEDAEGFNSKHMNRLAELNGDKVKCFCKTQHYLPIKS
jgi:hypothetical protein